MTMTGIITDKRYKVKSITIEDPENGVSVPVMMTAFDGEDQSVLQDAGYSGRYVMFTLIDGGISACETDPYGFDHFAVTEGVRRVMTAIVSGWRTFGEEGADWDNLRDGQTIEADTTN